MPPGLGRQGVSQAFNVGNPIIQPKRAAGHVELQFDMIYGLVLKRVSRVVKRAGRIAAGSARERAPIRKIFKGGRRTAPRFYSLAEARTELPAYLRGMRLSGTGRGRPGEMTKGEALKTLRETPIATSRNRANSWQRTGVMNYRTRAARDDLGNPRKDEHGNTVGAAMRDIEFAHGRDRLFDRSAEGQLTTAGKWELAHGRAISFGQKAKAEDSRFGKFKTERDIEVMKRSLDISRPGSEGQLGGSLRRSIELEDRSDGDKPKVSIVAGGEDAPYARFVEFGTRHAAAQPFLRPALKHVEGPYKSMMREAFPGAK